MLLHFSAGEALNNLLDRISIKDLALRAVLDEAEMLVFSSIILPEYCQSKYASMIGLLSRCKYYFPR